MSDFCLICETEPIENDGWFVSADESYESICPWCIRDIHFLRDLVLDVHMMITPDEFIKVFNTKFGINDDKRIRDVKKNRKN